MVSVPLAKEAPKMKRLVVMIAVLFCLAAGVFAQVANGHQPCFRVVDRNSRLVGFSITENIVARQIDRRWVRFYVDPAHGIFDSQGIYVYFLTTDCSGPQYLPRYHLFFEGTRVGPKLMFPIGGETRTVRSVRVLWGDGSAPGECLPVQDTYVFGEVASVDVEALGLVLPFRIVE
jgi:hypothetical protein